MRRIDAVDVQARGGEGGTTALELTTEAAAFTSLMAIWFRPGMSTVRSTAIGMVGTRRCRGGDARPMRVEAYRRAKEVAYLLARAYHTLVGDSY